MPVISSHYRKAFRWVERDGLPVATITELNARGWLLVCPLCGCMHETRAQQLTGPYKPDCLLRTLAAMPAPRGNIGANWRRVLQDWYAIHPQAAQHDTVLLLDAEAVENPVANLPQGLSGRTRTLTDEQRQRKNERARARRAAAGKYEELEKAA